MDFALKDIIVTVLGGLGSIIGWAILNFLGKMEKNFERLTDSVEHLNVSVALVVQQAHGLERRIDRLEQKQGE